MVNLFLNWHLGIYLAFVKTGVLSYGDLVTLRPDVLILQLVNGDLITKKGRRPQQVSLVK